MTGITPNLTVLVVAFVVIDALALLVLVGGLAGATTAFFGRHRAIRTARRESFVPYYRHVALHH